MKFKYLILTCLTLPLISIVHASSMVDLINETTINLGIAESNLQYQLNLEEESASSNNNRSQADSDLISNMTYAASNLATAEFNLQDKLNLNNENQTAVNRASMLTNNSSELVLLAMIDENEQQINPTKIPLYTHEFSYILGNVKKIHIIGSNNEELTTIAPITSDSHYNIAYEDGVWSVRAITENQEYAYKNETRFPLNLTITTDKNIENQQVNPGESYSQMMNPSEIIDVQAHANIAAISRPYNPAASYALEMTENNKLELVPISEVENNVVNNCDFAILVNFISVDDQHESTVLETGSQFSASIVGSRIVAVPLIPNYIGDPSLRKSYTFTNVNGNIALAA